MAEDWENTKILRDQDNNPIPQIWDSEQKKFVPYEGQVKLTGIRWMVLTQDNASLG